MIDKTIDVQGFQIVVRVYDRDAGEKFLNGPELVLPTCRFRMQGDFKYEGEEYEVNCEFDDSEYLSRYEAMVVAGARRKLGELGAIVWPPPLDDLKVWGVDKLRSPVPVSVGGA